MNSGALPVLWGADGRQMAYRRLGHGPPVVCLAGGPGANAEYLEDLGGLSRGYELVVPDARGTGGSAPPEKAAGYWFDELAKDVEALREHLGLEKMTMLAHSAACTTALVYAATHPDRLQAFVMVAPNRWLYDEIEDDTRRILNNRSAEPWYPTVMSAQRRLDNGPDPDEIPGLLGAIAPALYAQWGEREQAHAATMKPANMDASRLFWQADVHGREVRARLELVEAPVLVITGELDAATGVNPGNAWAACFPDGRHVNIEGSGHHPWVDKPETFANLVSDFLSVGHG